MIKFGAAEGRPDGFVDAILIFDGTIEGKDENEIEGLLDSSEVGLEELEGELDLLGESEGALECKNDGIMDGSIDGNSEGIDEGTCDGFADVVGVNDGINEGVLDGCKEGSLEGSLDTLGPPEGKFDGKPEGAVDTLGAMEGIEDIVGLFVIVGSKEGIFEGTPDGSIEGDDELEGADDVLGAREGSADTVGASVVGAGVGSTSINVTSKGVPSSGKTIGTALIVMFSLFPTAAERYSSAAKLDSISIPLKE